MISSSSHSQALLPNPDILIPERIERDANRFRLTVHVEGADVWTRRFRAAPRPRLALLTGSHRRTSDMSCIKIAEEPVSQYRNQRSLADLLNIVERIGKAGAGFRSLGENLDTTSPAGRTMMQMVGVFAEFERSIIRERTKAGLAEARKAGRKLGRRFKLSEEDRKQIVYLVREGKMTAADCARTYRMFMISSCAVPLTPKTWCSLPFPTLNLTYGKGR